MPFNDSSKIRLSQNFRRSSGGRSSDDRDWLRIFPCKKLEKLRMDRIKCNTEGRLPTRPVVSAFELGNKLTERRELRPYTEAADRRHCGRGKNGGGGSSVGRWKA
jgi:hypothetical protein